MVKYENMALLSPVMHINGILNPNAVGIQGEKAGVNEKMTQDSPIPMKITIIGGQVRVEIPSLNMGRNFEGMLLGTAINSK